MARAIAFLRGMYEFRRSFTWADSDEARDFWDGYTPLDAAYDCGREWAHRLTLRKFEE
jgi:hypothetical protein